MNLRIDDNHGTELAIEIVSNSGVSRDAQIQYEQTKKDLKREAALRQAAVAQNNKLESEKEGLEKRLEYETQKSDECILALNQQIHDLKTSNAALINENEKLRESARQKEDRSDG